MQANVKNVKTLIKIIFKDGSTYDLPCVNKNYMTENLKTYCTSVKLDEKLYASSSSNIVGNICANTLDIELISNDKLLSPTNENSPYYGMMNDTAMVEIKAYIVDEDYTENMGTYFVSAWDGGLNADTSNEISISCVDLLSKIKNISLNNIRLRRNIKFNDYLKAVIDELNLGLPDSMKILYSDEDLNIFRNSRYDWDMYFNNIDRADIETIFNCVAKDTISYIWIDRDRHLKTDHLLDDEAGESVCGLSGSIQILEYGLQSGGIDSYSGVKVEYIEEVLYEDKQLLQLQNIQLLKGDNAILNQTLNSSSVYKINLIEIECEDGSYAFCYSQDYYKNIINMYIDSENKTLATITVYGTVINESCNVIERYIDDDNKNDVVEISNKVLYKGNINTYVDGTLNLISMKRGLVQAKGWINPRVRLGNTVYMEGSRLGIKDYYKVIGLKFTFGSSYRCIALLMRVISTSANVSDILMYNASKYHDMLMGVEVSPDEFKPLSESDNNIVESVYVKELAEWRAVLYGG